MLTDEEVRVIRRDLLIMAIRWELEDMERLATRLEGAVGLMHLAKDLEIDKKKGGDDDRSNFRCHHTG